MRFLLALTVCLLISPGCIGDESIEKDGYSCTFYLVIENVGYNGTVDIILPSYGEYFDEFIIDSVESAGYVAVKSEAGVTLTLDWRHGNAYTLIENGEPPPSEPFLLSALTEKVHLIEVIPSDHEVELMMQFRLGTTDNIEDHHQFVFIDVSFQGPIVIENTEGCEERCADS